MKRTCLFFLPLFFPVICFSQNRGLLMPVRVGNNWGYIDTSGTMVVNPVYDHVETFVYSAYAHVVKDGKTGILNRKGKVVIPPIYDEINVYENSDRRPGIPYQCVMIHRSGGKTGCSDQDGKAILNEEWSDIHYDKLLLVKKEASLFFYNPVFFTGGKPQISNVEAINIDTTGHFYVYTGRNFKKGLLDSLGRELLPPLYNEIKYQEKDLLYINLNGKFGVADRTGSMRIDPQFDMILPMKFHMAIMIGAGKFGVINNKCKILLEPEYDKINITQYKIKARKGNKLVIIDVDETGEVIDKNEYENVNTISFMDISENTKFPDETVASDSFYVAQNWFYSKKLKKWGILGSSGDTLLKAVYDKVYSSPVSEYSVVEIFRPDSIFMLKLQMGTKSRFGIINNNSGVIISAMIYNNICIEDFYDTASPIVRCYSSYSGWGYLDKKNNYKYNEVTYIDKCGDGLFRVIYKGKILPSFDQKIFAGYYIDDVSGYFRSFSHQPTRKRFRLFDIYCMNGDWGYINKNRQFISHFQYAGKFVKGKAIARKDGKWGVIDEHFETVIPFEYDSITLLRYSDTTLFKLFIRNNKFGLMNYHGDVLTDMKYDNIGNYSEGLAWVKKRSLYGFIDEQGHEITDFKFKRASSFYDGMAAVKAGTKWGYVNTQGEMEIEPRYAKANSFGEGMAFVNLAGKTGFIDKSGTMLFKIKCSRALPYMNGSSWIQVSGKFGLIDPYGKWILKPKYEQVMPYGDQSDLTIVKAKKGFGLVNRKGEVILPCRYGFIRKLSASGMAVFGQDNLMGYLDEDGKIAINAAFDQAYDFHYEYAIVEKNKYFTIIDKTGNPPESLISLRKSIANDVNKVPFNHGVTFINSEIGGLLIGNHYFVMDSVSNERYYLKYSKQIAKGYMLIGEKEPSTVDKLLDRDYDVISAFLDMGRFYYDDLVPVSDSLVKYRQKYVYGIASYDGTLICKPRFDNIYYYDYGIFMIKYHNSLCYLKKDGTWVWPPRY